MMKWLKLILFGFFVILWLVGNASIFFGRSYRLANNEAIPDDPTGSFLIGVAEDNQFWHPYFYLPLETSFRRMIEELPETTPIHLISDTSLINTPRRLIHLRYAPIWAYPHPIEISLGIQSIVNLPPIPDDTVIAISGVMEPPRRICTQHEEGLLLCR